MRGSRLPPGGATASPVGFSIAFFKPLSIPCVSASQGEASDPPTGLEEFAVGHGVSNWFILSIGVSRIRNAVFSFRVLWSDCEIIPSVLADIMKAVIECVSSITAKRLS